MIRSLGANLLLWITGLCLSHSAAGQEVEIVMPTFANLVTESGDGLYQQLFVEAAESIDLSYTVRVYPIKRAWQYFAEQKDSCLLTFYDIVKDQLGEDKVVAAYPFGVAKLHVFSRRGEPVIRSLDELEGKTVAGSILDSSHFGRLVGRGISIDVARNYRSSFSKLRAGRLDLMLGILPDMFPFLGEFDYDPDFPIATFFDRMACHNNALGQSLTERISGALESMKRAGVTENIMGDQYIEFDY